MSYLALARKWRPKKFSEVIGQEHIVSALTHALADQRIHHALLFTGTRGVGKTTLARIVAKALNCEQGVSAEPCGHCLICKSVDIGSFIDLIEVDAASRTRVDDTRELMDNVLYTPSQGRYKIYLIDEVHMLSTHSFNALLKTLEEPPEYVKFLLATTDPQKLPATVLSRCIQFNLKSLDLQKLAGQLEKILKSEKIPFELPALNLLARSANGSVRDALSLLDQAIAHGKGSVNQANVRQMLGMIDDRLIINLLNQILALNHTEAMNTVSAIAERSTDYGTALDDLLLTIHNVSLFQVAPEAVKWKELDLEVITSIANTADPEILQLVYQIGVSGKKDMEYAPDPRCGFEMIILRMLAFLPEQMLDQRKGQQVNSAASPENTESLVKPVITAPQSQLTSQISSGSGAKKPDQSATRPKNTNTANQVSHPQYTYLTYIDEHKQRIKSQGGLSPTEENQAHSKIINALIEPVNWKHFIENCGLTGLLNQVVMNMAPVSVDGQTLNISFTSHFRTYNVKERLKQIETLFSELLSVDLSLCVHENDSSSSEANIETPAQTAEREKKETKEAARNTFKQDPNVKQMLKLFGGKVDTDSVTSKS